MSIINKICLLLSIQVLIIPTVDSKSLLSKFRIEESSVARLNTQSKTILHDFLKKDDCPCSDPSWCEPIKDVSDKEVFVFSIRNDATHWELFDWSKLTTVVMFGYLNSSLTCLAHSHNVKVVILGDVSVDIFTNTTKRQQWIQNKLLLVKQNFLDGINFDFEGQVGLNDTLVRDSYTALVKETALAFKKDLPYSQISVDVGWKPNVDIRFFDYLGLADAADLLFVMAYDEQSQIFGECIAGPNSAYKSAAIGLDNYLNGFENKIPSNKLILGVPWYGYIYECTELVEDKCYIKEVPFRGVNCSDAAGNQYDYGPIYNLIQTMPEKYQWNSSSLTPFLTYTNAETNQSYQVQFDDPRSLKLKYDLAAQKGLKGVGMWNIDALDYSDTQVGEYIRSEMFGALPSRSKVSREVNMIQQRENFTCPCKNPIWCEPVKSIHQNEKLYFFTENDENHWQKFDWSKITSVIMHNYINANLVCLAHSHNVRVFINGDFDEAVVVKKDWRKKWIADQISLLKRNFLDGISFNFSTQRKDLQDDLTDFVQQAFISIKKELPHVQAVRNIISGALPSHSKDLISVSPGMSDHLKNDDALFINLKETLDHAFAKVFLPTDSFHEGKSPCPCDNPKWCEPIKEMSRKEVYAFSLVNNDTHWKEYDWSKITTVCMFNYVNPLLMCLAHSYNVRAVTLGNVDLITMITPELRQQWVAHQLQVVKDNYLDGLNFDVEMNISPEHKDLRDAYTALVNETVTAFKRELPYSQISIDVQADAFTTSRSYDYVELAKLADFLFIMAYDESGFDIVGPNAGVPDTVTGLLHYFQEKISPDKLVLGLPWYGYIYICSKLVGDVCYLSSTRAEQVDYNSISAILETMPDNYKWNSTSETPYFSYTDLKTNISYQVHFDDATSLQIKYEMASDIGLRGVGMWTVDFLDYTNSDRGKRMREAMFGALPSHSTY